MGAERRTYRDHLGSVAAAALVVLAVQAARRRRAEVRRERAGSLQRIGPDGDPDPSRPVRGLAAAVGGWVPPPLPRARRQAALAWASPATLVGLGLALLGGSLPRWDDRAGALVATGIGGPSGWALALAGLGANTMGHVIVTRQQHPSERLLAHESVHVRQFERLGVLLYPLYLWYAARYGYRDNPLEVAARRGARHASNGIMQRHPRCTTGAGDAP